MCLCGNVRNSCILVVKYIFNEVLTRKTPKKRYPTVSKNLTVMKVCIFIKIKKYLYVRKKGKEKVKGNVKTRLIRSVERMTQKDIVCISKNRLTSWNLDSSYNPSRQSL